MEIRTYGDPILRRKAEPVAMIDDEIRSICQTMVEVMLRENGLGLAAPQIGISRRIFVLDIEGELHILINPEIVSRSDEGEDVREGCLSVPGVDAEVSRSLEVSVEGLNLDGDTIRIDGTGLLARAIQHEMDHLDGKLFLDQLSMARRQSLVKEFQRKQREKDD